MIVNYDWANLKGNPQSDSINGIQKESEIIKTKLFDYSPAVQQTNPTFLKLEK